MQFTWVSVPNIIYYGLGLKLLILTMENEEGIWGPLHCKSLASHAVGRDGRKWRVFDGPKGAVSGDSHFLG